MSGIDRVLVESKLAELDAAVTALERIPNLPVEIREVAVELESLKEELSTGDWGRIGVLAGLLWYKLDTLIKVLGDNNQELKNIGNHLRK